MTPVADPNKYPSLVYEERLWNSGYTQIAGVDEAGRGAWAGPVYAAMVILPPDLSVLQQLAEVRDSKLMTPTSRARWAPRIRAAASFWSVGCATAAEIDLMGILPATKLAASRALENIVRATPAPHSPKVNPGFGLDYLLTDYLIFPNLELPQTALIKGDRQSLSIAAASVLAKTSRDAYMVEMESVFPGYGFSRHKGYGTHIHQEAIHRLGLCEIHRKSFNIL